MQVGGLGLIPYRTIQFYNEQYALWQVVETRMTICDAQLPFAIAGGLLPFKSQMSNPRLQIPLGL